MTMNKNILTALAFGLGAVGLAACGGESAKTEKAAPADDSATYSEPEPAAEPESDTTEVQDTETVSGTEETADAPVETLGEDGDSEAVVTPESDAGDSEFVEPAGEDSIGEGDEGTSEPADENIGDQPV